MLFCLISILYWLLAELARDMQIFGMRFTIFDKDNVIYINETYLTDMIIWNIEGTFLKPNESPVNSYLSKENVIF